MELRPSMDILQVAKLLGRRWRDMPERDKEMYYRMEAKEKAAKEEPPPS